MVKKAILVIVFLLSGRMLDATTSRSEKTGAAAVSVAQFDQERLRHYAEEQGFGYKTANLRELEIACREFNRTSDTKSTQLAVPSFVGVASQKIQAKLEEVGFQCSSRWSVVLDTVAGEFDDIRATKKFPGAFLAARDDFNDALNQAWGKLVVASKTLDAFFGIEGLDDLLAAVKRRGNRLMVRSTGKEDTKELANAGGNASVPNVRPTAEAVLVAMREVVESYFGMKSLTQRLGLGDTTLFDPAAFTPVLVQEMIGEKADDASPTRCGVMFTEEPEGAIKAEPNDAGFVQTTGITLIQAAYGHNEAVVNSLVPVDTYYVMRGDNAPIYPVVRAKTSRLVPAADGSSKLTMVKNKKILVMTRVLADNQIRTLKSFADKLEQYYGYPMDVEFVVKGNTVFIVQARPIVHKLGQDGPSYLREGIDGVVYSGATIGAAGGSVRVIEEANQILAAPTIGVALNTYLQPDFDSKKVKAVLVGAMAPSTSHEATTFRNEGLPVLYLEAWGQLLEQLREGGKLLISPQQNIALITDVLVDSDILLGWNSYPIPRALSVLPLLFGAIGEATPTERPLKIAAKPEPWSKLLSIMKIGSYGEVVAATAQFLAQFDGILKNMQ